MIKYLKLFDIDPSGDLVVITPGVTFNTIENDLSVFFLGHGERLVEDRNTQNFRFKNKNVEFINYLESSFRDIEGFNSSTQSIADKMKGSLSKNAKNNFYLIIFTYCDVINDNNDYLCVLKMDSLEGIHVNNEMTLERLSRMLPDKKSRLQKGAVIYRSHVQNYVDNLEPKNSERLHIHSKILDRQDADISGLFSNNFLDSLVVTDKPESIGKLAVNSIVSVSKNYLDNSGFYGIKDIKNILKNELSTEKDTTFDALTDIIYSKLDRNKLGDKTSEEIASEAFELAHADNPTVVRSFKGKFRKPNKIRLVDTEENGEINISYLESLEKSQKIKLDSLSDEEFHILKIKKNIVKMK